jgi:hypothetical protein
VDAQLGATEIAYLNGGGNWAATRTALAMLHARGRLAATGRGRVERIGFAGLAATIDAGRIDPATLTIDEISAGVALFGNRALRSLMPVAARDAGLLDGGRWTRLVRHNSDSYGSWTGAAMSELDHHNPTSPF